MEEDANKLHLHCRSSKLICTQIHGASCHTELFTCTCNNKPIIIRTIKNWPWILHTYKCTCICTHVHIHIQYSRKLRGSKSIENENLTDKAFTNCLDSIIRVGRSITPQNYFVDCYQTSKFENVLTLKSFSLCDVVSNSQSVTTYQKTNRKIE